MADPKPNPAGPTNFDALATAPRWSEQLIDPAEWAAELGQPYDDCPEFGASDPEVNAAAGLPADRAMMRTPTRRLYVDYRANPVAYKHIETIPEEGQSLHGVISGRYAMCELIPALIERANANYDALTVATLSFSKQNANDILDLIDAGRIKRFTLLVSYFFKAQNREIYDFMVPAILDKGHRVLAARTHAKILLAAMTNGAHYTVEGSANLRSCRNVEQFVLTRDAALYNFHMAWIDELFAQSRPHPQTPEPSGNE